MIVGDRASDDHAVNEAIELAELLGLPVYQSRGAEVAFPTTHPQFMGNLSLRVADHREILKRVDLVLTVGMDTFEGGFVDIHGTNLGEALFAAAKPGKIGEAHYDYERPTTGSTKMFRKTALMTRVSGIVCGVGYYNPQ